MRVISSKFYDLNAVPLELRFCAFESMLGFIIDETRTPSLYLILNMICYTCKKYKSCRTHHCVT